MALGLEKPVLGSEKTGFEVFKTGSRVLQKLVLGSGKSCFTVGKKSVLESSNTGFGIGKYLF